ncbi:hypothetical protein EKO04_000209 [Ascochyta lentis]|uniref:Altered inheritance of mitochondria protein 32 n=1 Tax=Ascochyta lentis TaxID=205686 RepID=A0A8H7MHM4_9PLEO|nr:hypothetical protein EKO04_000209 [Ascochyta lentis]
MSLALPRLSRARIPHLRLLRPFSSTPTRYSPSPVPSIPYTESCPAPTCACAPTPADLDIDRTTPLLNTMAPYAEQVLLCTGKEDWASNLEDEGGATAEFVKGMKGVIGRGGEAFDPFTNILLTASSLPASEQKDSTTAYLFPSFLRIPNIPHSHAAYRALASAYLSAETLHPTHAALSASQKEKITRDTAQARLLPRAERVTQPVILICGHGGRDRRCGVLGPLLQDQFRAELARRGVRAQVALVSHIGGHKYAGNVVVYLPPGWRADESKTSELKMSQSNTTIHQHPSHVSAPSKAAESGTGG